MATKTRTLLSRDNGATHIDVTYDDVTLALLSVIAVNGTPSQLQAGWTNINSGRTVSVTIPPGSFSQNIPAGHAFSLLSDPLGATARRVNVLSDGPIQFFYQA